MNEASEVYRFGGAEQGKDEQYFHYLIQKANLAYLGPCTQVMKSFAMERMNYFSPKIRQNSNVMLYSSTQKKQLPDCDQVTSFLSSVISKGEYKAGGPVSLHNF